MSMTWTTLTSLSFLFTSFWTQAWSPVSSFESPQIRPLSFQEVRRVGMPDLNSGAAANRLTRLGDVEPPRLPPLDGFHESAFQPRNVGHPAHHGASALRLAALHNLRLDTEGLEPQAEVGLDAEEGLTHDDKRRDVEDEIRGQIMEIQAVVEHEPPDKGMKWEA